MYITYIPTNLTSNQITFRQAIKQLYGTNITIQGTYDDYSTNYITTRTIVSADIIREGTLPHLSNIHSKLIDLSDYCDTWLNTLLDRDTSQCYEHFSIPKHSGGLRHISSPNPDIRSIQEDVVKFFTNVSKSLAHNNAYGFVKGRCTKDALVTHQRNEARWFLKLDLKDFFPSCTKEFIVQQLSQLYPFSMMPSDLLGPVVEVCLLAGGLPQGAPSSPIITNLIMIPIDYKLNEVLYNYKKSHYTYTRYADDILISSKFSFKYTDIIEVIQQTLVVEKAPFTIHPAKTRYGSFNGRNWNLGLMYNNQGKITVGHRRKRRVKSMINNFLRDNVTATTPWSKQDTQVLLGEIAYIEQIEGNNVLNKHNLEQKYNTTIMTLAKPILRDEL